MSWLDATELAELRTLAESTMDDVALIERESGTQTGRGGEVVSWTTVASGVACRLFPLDVSRMAAIGSREQAVSGHGIAFPIGTDIDERDRITVTGKGVYRAMQVDPRTTEIERIVRVIEWE